MKRVVVATVLLITAVPSNAKVVSFVQNDFHAFVSQSVMREDQERFKGYYEKLQDQIQLEDNDKQKKTREYLYNKGFSALERDKRQWHACLTDFLSPAYLDSSYDAERNQVREFVYWYGALEEFNQARQDAQQAHQIALEVEKEKNVLSNAKTSVAKATKKVGTWFKGWWREDDKQKKHASKNEVAQAQEEKSMLANAKTSVAQATKKVGSWFKRLSSSVS